MSLENEEYLVPWVTPFSFGIILSLGGGEAPWYVQIPFVELKPLLILKHGHSITQQNFSCFNNDPYANNNIKKTRFSSITNK